MDGNSCSTQTEADPSTQSELTCNICFRRMPISPVVPYCGHVFCWPCLYRSWPQQGPEVQGGPAITKTCPVCGTALREGFNIVPIYAYDDVASPSQSGTERATTTGTTTAAAAAAPDTANAAPVSDDTPIPPRPTAASFFTTTPPSDSVADWVVFVARSATTRAMTATTATARVSAAATSASNPPITPRSTTTVSVNTDIPPRPNPARMTQTLLMDAAEVLRDFASPFPGHGNRASPSYIDLRVARRSIHRRLNLLLSLRGICNNGGNWSESYRASVVREVIEILEDIGASHSLIPLFNAYDGLGAARNRPI